MDFALRDGDAVFARRESSTHPPAEGIVGDDVTSRPKLVKAGDDERAHPDNADFLSVRPPLEEEEFDGFPGVRRRLAMPLRASQ